MFTNLVDFDSKYGHRNDPTGYAGAVEALDARLPEIVDALDGGVLMMTGDHGCDPTTPPTDHSRERTPLLAAGLSGGPFDIGTRGSFGDLGQTVADLLGVEVEGLSGGELRGPDRTRMMTAPTLRSSVRIIVCATVIGRLGRSLDLPWRLQLKRQLRGGATRP